MLNIIKRSSQLCYLVALFWLGILCIFFLSNIPHPLNISTSWTPTAYQNRFQYLNERNHTSKVSGEIYNQSQDIIAVKIPIKVSIGTVVCHTPFDLGPREEALVLLKSTIISAILYQTFPIIIEFHLFLEHQEDQEYFIQNTKSFSKLTFEIQVNLFFHSVFDAVPKQNKRLLFGPGLRCTYVRIFFPRALSKVDSILYLDTDVIIVGSLEEIWNNFYTMKNFELVGAVMDIEPDNKPWFRVYQDFFLNTPLPTIRGLNAGVLLMNLTKMREFQFEDKIMKLYKDYSIRKNDQTLLNTLLYYNPYLLHLLPCQYNFRPTACTLGFYCNGVLEDPTGIQIIHQYTKSSYLNMDNAFRDIAEAYQEITDPINLRTNLVIKVRNMYKKGFRSFYNHGKCNGVLDNLLFKQLFL